MRGSASSPNYMEGAERRLQIVESAIRTFAKHGFHGSTTKRLAKDADVSEGLIYRYFSSKEEVYRAVLEHLVDSSPRMGIASQSSPLRDDRLLLLNFARDLYAFFSRHPENMKVLLFSALQGEPISQEFFNRSMRNSYETIIERVDSGQKSGRYRAETTPRVAARAFMGMLMYHIIVQALVDDPYQGKEAPDWVGGFVDIFLDGMTAGRH